MAYPKPPKSFLTVNIFDISVEPFIHSLCVGYENGLWRDDAFAKHVIAWLPEFCLTESELKLMDSSNATELMRKAVNLVYDTEKYEKTVIHSGSCDRLCPEFRCSCNACGGSRHI